jgi:WD40 repeat protein
VVLWDVARRTQLTGTPLLIDQDYQVTSVAFSPDGATMTTVCDGQLAFWDVARRQRLAEMPLAELESVECVAFSPDGKTLAAAYRRVVGGGLSRRFVGGCLVIWDMQGRSRLAHKPVLAP